MIRFRVIIISVLMTLSLSLSSPIFGPFPLPLVVEKEQVFSSSDTESYLLAIEYKDANGLSRLVLSYFVGLNGSDFYCTGPTGTTIVPRSSVTDAYVIHIF